MRVLREGRVLEVRWRRWQSRAVLLALAVGWHDCCRDGWLKKGRKMMKILRAVVAVAVAMAGVQLGLDPSQPPLVEQAPPWSKRI